jgi:gliding motility-associated-like protein
MIKRIQLLKVVRATLEFFIRNLSGYKIALLLAILVFSSDRANAAKLYFNDIYKATGNSYTTSTQGFATLSFISGSGFKFTSANPADVSFSGNNIAGILSYTNLSNQQVSLYGVISRQDKSGSTTMAVNFLPTDNTYTTVTGEGYILVIPTKESSYSNGINVATSSDPIDTVLNNVLATQSNSVLISVNDVTVYNTDSYAVFTISLSKAANANTTFTPNLTPVTATLSTDYTNSMQYYNGSTWVNISSTVIIAQGATSIQILVPILNAGAASNRTFNLNTGAVTGSNVLNSDGAYGIGTIVPPITAGSITASQTICVGATPASFTSTSAASGGVGTINYQWETSTNNTTWNNVASATSATYSPGAISVNTYFRRKASTSTDAPVYTSAVLITVQQSVGGSIAGSAAVCAGTNATILTLSGQTGSITKWQSALAADFSGTITDILSTTASITATNLTATNYYRAVVTLGSCTSVNSSIASVTVNALPTISVTPSSATIVTGNSVTLTASGASTYSWSPSASLSASNTSSVSASPTATTTYTVTGVAASSCSSTASVTVTVNAALSAGAIATDQTICVGATPASLTSTTAASGGVGTINYQWETSADNSTWSDVAGATSATYSPGAVSVNTYFRRKASTSTDAAVYTTAVLITVQQSVGGSIAGSAIVCPGTNSTVLTLSGQTGSITKWQSSLNSNFSAATDINSNTASVTVTNLNSTTYYRAVVTLGSCTAATSGTASVTVNPAPTISINVIPDVNTSATIFTIPYSGLSNGDQYSITTGTVAMTGFSAVTNNSISSASGTITVTIPTSAQNSYDFNLTLTNSSTGCTTQRAFNLVVSNINPGTTGTDQSICYGTIPAPFTSLTAATSGATYQWQMSTTGITGNYTDISGATSDTYTHTTVLTVDTYFRRKATLGNDFGTAHPVEVLVNALPTVSVTPSSASITTGSSVTLTASGASTYSWSPSTGLSASNTGAVSATPTATTTYTVTGTNSTTSCSSTASMTITVNPALSAGAISAAQTICVGATPATLTSSTDATGGTGSIVYEWQSSTDGTTFTTISGATSSTYSPGAISVNTYFRRGASTANDASVYNSAILITVQQSVGGSIAGSATVCAGTNSTVLTLSGQTGAITKWQSSLTSNFASTTDITNTTSSLTATNLSATTYYRAVITLGSCTAANSSSASVTVTALPSISVTPSSASITSGSNVTLTASGASTYSWSPSTGLSASNTGAVTATPTATTTYTVTGTRSSCSSTATVTVIVTQALSAGAISAAQTICVGATPASLTSTADATGGTGSVTYVWQSSTNGTTFTTISGATSSTYSPGAISVNTYFRRGASTANDAVVYSSAILITVQESVGGSIAGSATVCAGTNSTVLTLSGQTGSITKWQSSLTSNFASATDITNTTSSLTATNLSATTYYRAVITLGSCTATNSSSASLTVTALPSISVTPSSASITSGSSVILTASGASTYSWSPSTGLSASNTAAVTATPTATTTYTVTGTRSSCSSTATVTVTVTPANNAPADTDGDGVTDAQEIADNTDPNDGCSYVVASRTLTPSAAWEALDCDADGNSNATDPHVDAPSASNDVVNIDNSGTATINVLVNDDFLPGVNTELTRQASPNEGTARGTVSFDPLTGVMTYKRAPFEYGLKTLGYKVTNKAANPPVSATAFVTILACDLADPLSDCDGDGELNGTDLAPTDPCVYEPTRQVKANVSDDWKALDCDGDGVLNGTELLDGTSASDACSFKATSITLAPSAAWLALDCDADGITNKVEGTQDFDGDGIPNCLDTDSDGDSISDKLETTVDTDKDGKPDYLDLDSDNDGILDSVENKVCTGTSILCDTDADGIPNFRDLDSDGDKINDVIEATGSDYNGDGIADGNVDAKGIPSSANRGLTPPDTDRDGKLDPYDVDSDGDGILDFDEEYNEDADFADCDKDGIVNRLDPDECDIFSPQGISPNGDGKNDRLVFKGLFLRKIPNHLSVFNRWGTLVFEMESYDNSFTGTLLPDGTYYYILDFFGKKPTISNYLSVDRMIK